MRGEGEGDEHGHGDCSLFGIGTGERHPGDVERMREGSEDLSPDDTEVLGFFLFELGEATVEDVTNHVTSKTCDDSLTTEVARLL